MASKKKVAAQRWLKEATELESQGDFENALKRFQKATTSDPSNIKAWQRQFVLYRKTKSRKDEIKLVAKAIEAVKKARADAHEAWEKANLAKVESSRALATSLGLLDVNGFPKMDDRQLENWETRLYLLKHREAVARKKSPKQKN
ncbi:MAG: hypothetical protein EOO42_02125 [Flavobacteriales bacterium]|nr:MAG: hypothetical protein EOO42_02125 [Flavobacteriales bacterium]